MNNEHILTNILTKISKFLFKQIDNRELSTIKIINFNFVNKNLNINNRFINVNINFILFFLVNSIQTLILTHNNSINY